MIGSKMLQMIDIVCCSWNGSITAVDGSGIRIMSDSEISWKPRIEEPSKPRPSSNASSSSPWIDSETCCQVPGRSVNLKSTIRTPCLRAISSTCRGSGSAVSAKRCTVSGAWGIAVVTGLTPSFIAGRRPARTSRRPRRRAPVFGSALTSSSRRLPVSDSSTSGSSATIFITSRVTRCAPMPSPFPLPPIITIFSVFESGSATAAASCGRIDSRRSAIAAS